MKTCDDYQLELEQRRRGALSPAAAEEAEGHLAGCATCQAAEALARRTEALLTEAAATAVGRVDWERVRRAIEREHRAYRLLPWIILVTFAVTGFGAGLAFVPQRWFAGGLRVTGIGVVFALFCWLYAALKLGAGRRAMAAGGEELLVYRRREVDSQLRQQRWFVWTSPLMMAPCLWAAVRGWDNVHHAGPALLAVALLLAASALHYGLVAIPRLRRERAELA